MATIRGKENALKSPTALARIFFLLEETRTEKQIRFFRRKNAMHMASLDCIVAAANKNFSSGKRKSTLKEGMVNDATIDRPGNIIQNSLRRKWL